MTIYGIKLVWAGWHNDNVIGFSDGAKKKWEDEIRPGTKMLIYETSKKRSGTRVSGTRSIVGEVIVTGTWEQGKGKSTPTEEHHHAVEVEVLQHRDDITPIPLHRVRQIIGENEKFAYQGQAFMLLTKEQYQKLLAELD